MRILLLAVNSQYIHSNPAVYALLRSVEQLSLPHTVERLDCSINMPMAEVAAAVYAKQPDVLACSMYIWNGGFLQNLLADMRQLLPQTLVVLGGPEATMRAADYMASCPADGVCLGEGEQSFPLFLRALPAEVPQGGKAELLDSLKAQQLPGWQWQGEDAPAAPAPLPDLAALPFLYTDAELAALKEQHKVVYYESSRGCPHACSFCASARERLRERPLALVMEELPRLAEGGGQIKFIDRTFNADVERAVAITKKVLELYRPGLSWHFEINPYDLPEELAALWLTAPPDYLKLEIGVQTLYKPALRAVGRTGDWDKAEPLIKRLIDARVHLHLDLIAGLPKDKPETFAASFHRLHQLSPDYLQFGFLKVLPGSLLAAQAERYGLVASSYAPYRILSTPDMDADYLFSLLAIERAFQALYNKGDFRSALLEKAERYEGGALAMYARAAELMPVGGANPKDKTRIVEML